MAAQPSSKRARTDAGDEEGSLVVLEAPGPDVMDISPGTLAHFPGEFWGYPDPYWAVVVCRGPPGHHVLYFPDGHTIELTADKDIMKYRAKRSKAKAGEKKRNPITRAELPGFLAPFWMVPLAVPPDSDGSKNQYTGMDGLLVGWNATTRHGIVYLRPHAPKDRLEWFHIINVPEAECKRELMGWARDPSKCIARMTDFPSIRPPRVSDAPAGAGGGSARAGARVSHKGGSLAVTKTGSLARAVKTGGVDLAAIMQAVEAPWKWKGSGRGPWSRDLQGQLTQVGSKHAWQFPDPIYASGSRLLIAVSNSTFPTEEAARLAHDRCMCHFIMRYAKNIDPLVMALERPDGGDKLWAVVHGGAADEGTTAAVAALGVMHSVADSTLFFPPPTLSDMAIMVYCVYQYFQVDYTYELEMRVFAVSVNAGK